jgi:hypothetical protein
MNSEGLSQRCDISIASIKIPVHPRIHAVTENQGTLTIGVATVELALELMSLLSLTLLTSFSWENTTHT